MLSMHFWCLCQMLGDFYADNGCESSSQSFGLNCLPSNICLSESKFNKFVQRIVKLL